jgi:predicted alpha/beta superfamily hydrolase
MIPPARVLLVAAFAACGAYVPAAAQELMPPHQTFTLHSGALNETRRINVYMPPGSGIVGAPPLPVLYMPDGGEEEDFPHVAATVDAGIRAGELRPMYVVGIENTERRRDMTGPTTVESDRRIAPRVGGSAAFRAFIGDELIPEIGHRFNVSDERAIIGESLAGLFVVETFFARPELFRTYIALSPSLWWNSDELVRNAGVRLRTTPAAERTLYLSSANEVEDIVPATARLAGLLRTMAPAGVTLRFEPRPDLRHDNIYRSSAPGVLRELFPAEKPRP